MSELTGAVALPPVLTILTDLVGRGRERGRRGVGRERYTHAISK
jgi:hypothetical protein